MLIIFDLDDTLIDTFGSIVPYKLKMCLEKLIFEGLEVKDFQLCYQRLLRLNESAKSSKDALCQFVKECKKESFLVEKILDELVSPLPKDFLVKTTLNAKEVLKFLSCRHLLALVTVGHPPFQLEKLEKAGIDRSIFSNIAIPEGPMKKPQYERLVQEFSVYPEDVIVCGDKVEIDLKPACELGLRTVHMKHGRGLKIQTDDWVNDSIQNLNELKRIVKA